MAMSDDGAAARLTRWLGPLLREQPLTAGRVAAAFAVAMLVDGVQIALGPAGFFVADEVLDVVAMGATAWLLGFDVLLLPTFLIELLPVSDVLPTWTGCVGLVVMRRRRRARRIVEVGR
jgi:hypothetical protein